jgi:23S rRNA A2030 N6-methylase RlmJ
MANRHFGKIADVWKHAALAEVLDREPPGWYAETHAGSGAYAVVHDREREFGILRFLEVAPRFAVLARSRYRAIAASYLKGDRGLYPGSALLAMTVLGDASSYLLCDLDRESITDLRCWSRELGLRSCEVAETDGMTAVAAWLDGEARGPRLVHIDRSIQMPGVRAGTPRSNSPPASPTAAPGSFTGMATTSPASRPGRTRSWPL